MSGEFGAKTYEPYLTALTDASEIIESLAHSEAFEKVLIENLRERRDTLTFDSVRVNQNDMPPEMIESHGLPSVFDISDFESEILETPAIPPAEETVDELQEPVDELEELLASQNPTNWLFTARYKVNGRPYSMTSSLDGTKLFTEGHDSETVVYDMPPSLATRVLSAIAVAVLVSKDIPARQALPHLENDEPEKLRQLMHNIGNLHGKYVSKKSRLVKSAG